MMKKKTFSLLLLMAFMTAGVQTAFAQGDSRDYERGWYAGLGGGTAPDSGWGRDKDDDEEWARRCAQMATRMSTPKPKYGYKRR